MSTPQLPDYLSIGLTDRSTPIPRSSLNLKAEDVKAVYTYPLTDNAGSSATKNTLSGAADTLVSLYSDLSTFVQAVEPGVYDEDVSDGYQFYAPNILNMAEYLIISEIDPVDTSIKNIFLLLS